MCDILEEVRQTGIAVRHGRPAKCAYSLGLVFYYRKSLNRTVYADSIQQAQFWAACNR